MQISFSDIVKQYPKMAFIPNNTSINTTYKISGEGHFTPTAKEASFILGNSKSLKDQIFKID
jgi:hypothetical protein